MPRRILVIEDDRNIADLVEYNLQKSGFEVHTRDRGHHLLMLLRQLKPALLILDVMLPDQDGFELCRDIRKEKEFQSLPILFLTAKGEEVDKVLGLELGADDYMTKPFSPRELVARVRAHVRRTEAEPASIVSHGPILLNRDECSVRVENREVKLSATEFKLLEYFLSHPNRVFSRNQLLDSVWGTEAFVTPRTVDVHIRRLREKIERDSEKPAFLKTVRGFGYKFESPLTSD
ncbi:MAG: response regulator transcription factor [Acidobacteriia bacterium]|nr:response regulator transcription factor [Terriglobia bacterium]